MNRESIVMGRKLGLKSTVWTRRKKDTSIQKIILEILFQNEETRIQKNEERLRNL